MTQGMMGGGGLAVPHVAQTAGSAASSLDAGRRPQRNARLAQDSNKVQDGLAKNIIRTILRVRWLKLRMLGRHASQLNALYPPM